MTFIALRVYACQCHHWKDKEFTNMKIIYEVLFYTLDLILIVILRSYCREKYHVTNGLLEVFAIVRWLRGSSRTSRHKQLISSPVSPGISSSAGLKWQNPLRYWFISANAASGPGYERYSDGLTRFASLLVPFICALGSH